MSKIKYSWIYYKYKLFLIRNDKIFEMRNFLAKIKKKNLFYYNKLKKNINN